MIDMLAKKTARFENAIGRFSQISGEVLATAAGECANFEQRLSWPLEQTIDNPLARRISRRPEVSVEMVRSPAAAEALQTILEPHAADGRIGIDGQDCDAAGKSITNLALLLHELATSGSKYGALAAANGHLQVTVENGPWP